MAKKQKELEIFDNKFKIKKQELIENQMRQINLCENLIKDRVWEGSIRLIKMELENRKDDIETIYKNKLSRKYFPK